MRAVSDPPDSYTQENRDLNKTSMPYEHVALYVSQAGKDDVEEPQQLKNVHTDEYAIHYTHPICILNV